MADRLELVEVQTKQKRTAGRSFLSRTNLYTMTTTINELRRANVSLSEWSSIPLGLDDRFRGTVNRR